ncbi:MAG TPA: glycosyltransferase family A protein [Gemmataceae bacterium]|nr:glycosyltransferase family A protein [Gemmataceae bacterium]
MSAVGLDGLARAGVTIAIPNWNHELLLPRAISSALRAVAQLRDAGVPGEVLVIDEASRDGSPLLLRQLEALYYRDGLRVLSMSDTGSLAASRNLALINARYRYVAFLDADNELIPENLPTFVRALEETEAAMVYGNLLVRTPVSRCAMNLLSNESVQLKLFQFNYIDAFALVDRCQFFDLGGYQESYRALEDHEMWQHLAVNGRKIVFVPLVFGYYYVLPSSMGMTAGNKATETAAHNMRIYNQLQARSHLPLNTRWLRFHPALGYL